MSKKVFSLVLICVVMSMSLGCAEKSVFLYDRPEMKAGPASGRILLCRETTDARVDREIDNAYEKETIPEVRNVIEQEMLSTGLFEKVVWTTNGQMSEKNLKSGSWLALDTSLDELKMEVPDRATIQALAFVISMATGGLGGVIYGLTPTDVDGTSKFTARLVALSSGKTLLDKKYRGKHTMSKTKFTCDSPGTQAEVAGKALKQAMEQFKADVSNSVRDEGSAAETVGMGHVD